MVKHLGRSVDKVDAAAQDGVVFLAIAVAMSDDILEVGLVENNIVRNQLCRVLLAVFGTPVIHTRVGVGVTTQYPILLACISRVIDCLVNDILHLELTVVVALLGCGTCRRIACSISVSCRPHMQCHEVDLLAI